MIVVIVRDGGTVVIMAILIHDSFEGFVITRQRFCNWTI